MPPVILETGPLPELRATPAGCVHHAIERQARLTPEAVAVVRGGESLTYAELDRRANRLAHELRGRGVGPEARVGVCLDRSPELLVGLLGIWKAGGAYVPLDPAYPAERLRLAVEDSGAGTVVTREHLAGSLPAGAAEPVLLDGMGESDAPPPPSAGPDNLAYVIYTSGSTGKPRGVLV
ncbi:MAG TPA: AMP-binding protein, partial [Longimicrobiaceae bacterium]|nr:AMP-binding protein [Longimicrobiaceae bacterium]